jgi:transposase
VAKTDPRDARIAELEALLATKDRRIEQLEAEVCELKGLLAQALRRIAELERQVAQNSQNSSRPPSSDGPGVVRRAKGPSGKKPGGQKGHKGHHRALVSPERVNATQEVKPSTCRKCQQRLEGEDRRPQRHQVVEVPALTAQVTEYRLHRLACGQCGARTRAALPKEVPSTCVGPHLTALLAFMTGRMRLSKREAREFLVEALGVSVSVGSISAVEGRASAALSPVYQQAEAFVRPQPWVNMDETGWRQRRRRAWLWVRATRKVSVFRVASTRSKSEAQGQLGEDFRGVAITDRFVGYNWVDTAQRQVCWAHLARDFQGLSQEQGLAGLVGQALVAQTSALFHAWGRYKRGRLNAWNVGRKLAPVNVACPVAFHPLGWSRAYQQQGRAGPEAGSALEKGQLWHSQPAGQSLHRATADGDGVSARPGAQRPGLPA